jgi:hypothetical protein
MSEENNIQQLIQSIKNNINQDFEDFTPIKKLSSRFSTEPSIIILALLAVILIISVLTSFLAHFLITLVGMVYPAYMSFKVMTNLYRL